MEGGHIVLALRVLCLKGKDHTSRQEDREGGLAEPFVRARGQV